MYRGWAWVEQGQIEEGIVQIRQGLAAYQATGAGVGVPYFLIQLAEAYGKVGQVEEGLALLDEALTAVDKTGERWWEAELYRIKGELLLNAECRMQNAELIHPSSFSVHHSAEECFHKALEVARRQQARSLELRAAMSLSRLWQKQSKKEEARQMLAEIYGWFTEGFDTADLKEAKKLLEELS
jgi:predicted ATPase